MSICERNENILTDYIKVEHLVKDFTINKRQKGLGKQLFSREKTIKRAVDDVSFSIAKGELVGYIGANGAGKSTTIKMLTGILTPTSGSVMVDGKQPYRSRKANSMHIGVVFGQRSQLYWDLPMADTFELYKKMYKIEDERYRKNVAAYVELLDMGEFIDRPARMLSLGQKMRANIAIALLHDPDILYLDEPTIGLDVLAKSRIRSFIREINREKGVTVILTTHDTRDIEEICERILLIDQGRLMYDGGLQNFKDRYSSGQLVEVEFKTQNVHFEHPQVTLIEDEGFKKRYLFKKDEITNVEVLQALLATGQVADLSLKDPDIEEVVRHIYVTGA